MSNQAVNDLLDMAKINALPHPLTAVLSGGDQWDVHDIDVETGLMRIVVGGLLQTEQFGGVIKILDADSNEHEAEGFYNETAPLAFGTCHETFPVP